MRDASRPKSSGGHSLRRLRGLETATTLVGPPGSRRSGGAVPAQAREPTMSASGELIGGRHRLQSVTGRGGMGVVWKARDEVSGRLTAVKFPLFSGPNQAQAEATYLREVLTTGASRHPNVVSVVDHGRTADGRLYIAFELLDGEDLATTLEQVEKLSVPAAAWVGVQVVEGLAAAHSRGIVHRDIKPSNIVVVRSGERFCAAKLIDFGLAWVATKEPGNHASPLPILGTPAFMSPEVCAGKPATAASDRYAVGCLLYQLVTGHAPFSGTVQDVVRQHQFTPAPALPKEIDGDPVPTAFRELVAALLEKQPGKRPQADAQVAATLLGIAGKANAVELSGVTGLQFAPLGELAPTSAGDLELSRQIFGREAEQAQLVELLDRMAREHGGGIVVLRGPEGIGKTHLATWLAEQARERTGARVLHRTFARPHGTAMPAVRDLVEDLLGLQHADARSCEATVWASIAGADPAERYQAEELLRFLRPDGHLAEPAGGDKQVRRAALFAAILKPFLREAARQPLVLLADDVHAADPMTLEWLATLVTVIRQTGAPILLCAMLREAGDSLALPLLDRSLQHAEAQGDVSLRQISLTPLPEGACVAWLAQSGRFDDGLTQHLTQLADGNPLFLETALMGYVADGRVQVRDGCWRAVVPLRSDRTLVDRLRTTVAEELDAFLRRHQRHRRHLQALLHVLAVVGGPQPLAQVREMFLALLEQNPPRPAFAQSVALASAAGLIARSAQGERDEIKLRHGAVADVVLARFADSAAAAHRAVAAVLRERGMPAPAYVPHLWRCGELMEAWQATRRGVAASAQLLDNHGTNRLLDEAERFGEPAGLLTMADLAWLLRHRGEALLALAQYDEAEARFTELAAMGPALVGEALGVPEDSKLRAHIGLAAVSEARSENAEALEHLEHALGATSDSPGLRGRIHTLRAVILRNVTRYAEACLEFEAAEQSLLTAGDHRGALEARIEQAMVAVLTCDFERADRLLRSAQAGLARAGDPFLQARFLYVMGSLCDGRRAYSESVHFYLDALAPLRAIGHRRGEAAVMANAATAYHYIGQFDAAEKMHLDALHIREELGDIRGIVASCNNIGDLYVQMGRPQDAVPVTQRALREAERCGLAHSVAVAYCTLGQTSLALGDLDGAAANANKALALDSDPPKWFRTQVNCLEILAAVASARQDFEQAYQLTLRANRLRRTEA